MLTTMQMPQRSPDAAERDLSFYMYGASDVYLDSHGICCVAPATDVLGFRALIGESTEANDFNRDAHHAPPDTGP